MAFLAHHLFTGFALYWLLSAFISGMPEPTPASSLAYHWLFGSLNAVAANLATLFRKYCPALPLFQLKAPTDSDLPKE